ncbi:MAG: hypothetical protein WBM35_15210, partial [Candidatus Electrothrix sp.]
MANKITQIYTLIDEASATLDDVARGYMAVDEAIDKNVKSNEKLAASEKKVNKETRETAETLQVIKQARVIEDKQVKSIERSYQRLIARYDAVERVTQRVAAAEKVLGQARQKGLIDQQQYEMQLRRVTRGIEDQTLAVHRNAAAQLSLRKIIERGKFILKTFIAALSIRAIYAFTQGVVQAQLTIDKMESTLIAATGSLGAANNALEFSKQVAGGLGLVYKDLAVQYAKFVASTRGTAIQDQSEAIF